MTYVDIIIVNWNSGQQLRACVDSLIRYGYSLVSKIIVVDNGSTDGSEKAIVGLPNVKLISAGKNLGFGKACNLGAVHASSEFLLFLNPDAYLFSESLPKVLEHMQEPENAKVGICGIQLVCEDGNIARSCARFPSISGFIAYVTGFDRIIPKSGHFMREWGHETTRQVDQVIGAFFLVRASIFKELRGFDERFFLYCEEVDFSYRAKQLGWSSIYFADVQAFHAGGGTSRQVKAKRLFYLMSSRLLYVFKHFSWTGALLVMFVTLLVEPLSRSMLAVLRLSWSGLKETWVAYGMLWCWMLQRIFKGVMF